MFSVNKPLQGWTPPHFSNGKTEGCGSDLPGSRAGSRQSGALTRPLAVRTQVLPRGSRPNKAAPASVPPKGQAEAIAQMRLTRKHWNALWWRGPGDNPEFWGSLWQEHAISGDFYQSCFLNPSQGIAGT